MTSFQVPIFPTFMSHWPDLRGHHLTYDLKTGYHWLRLVTTYTMFFPFFLEAPAQLGPNARGSAPTPLVPSKDAKWSVPARVKVKLKVDSEAKVRSHHLRSRIELGGVVKLQISQLGN